ncbi:hypothetical protein NP233_g270 [Leucocoprinus birnbaumii]|uniref:Uncharacterized protein n=1 Tax=Leucocoprinus birnbaumii TaxID=56174 RepID=A0AAD5Z0E2_9AGAR|nr:hypothetical protein NP233_g270 [Leucocoprinus birnbaumii]
MHFRSVFIFAAAAFFTIAQASPIPVAVPEAVAIADTTTSSDIETFVDAPSASGDTKVEERGCRFFCI